MKKLKLLILLVIGGAFISCEDSYEIVQDGEFDESATFQTVNDMEDFLSGVYSQATVQSEIGFTSFITDETGVGNANAGQNMDPFRFFVTNNDPSASTIWLNHYRLINYANRMIRGAGRITPAADELARYNSLLAEARALRAFGHFQLMSFFAEDMKNDGSLGVILMDRVPELTEQHLRSTTGEIFAFIESDIAFAEANLVDRVGMDKYYYISQNMLDAMKARMYAYRGNYTLANQFADEAIAGMAADGQDMNDASATPYNAGNFYNPTTVTNPYRRMWADLQQGEIIWGLRREAGEGAIAGIWVTNSTRLSGSPYNDMGRNLFNLMNDPNGDGLPANDFDIRRRAFIDPTSIVAANPATVGNYKNGDILVIDKYPGRAGEGAALTNDLKVFRLSEMYFIKAEALANAGTINGDGSVASILKMIRDLRTYNPAGIRPLPVYASTTEAWADILKERRVELCFEGHRLIDLKRLGNLAGGLSIDRYYRDCEDNNLPLCTLPLTDHRFVLPIPIDEIIGNTSIQQNPGY